MRDLYKPYYYCYRDVRQTVSPPLTTNHNMCRIGSARQASDTVCRPFCVWRWPIVYTVHCPHFVFVSKWRVVDWRRRLRDQLAHVLVFMACCGTSHAKSVFWLLAWVHFRFEKGFKCVLIYGGVCLTVVMTLCCRQVTERPVQWKHVVTLRHIGGHDGQNDEGGCC